MLTRLKCVLMLLVVVLTTTITGYTQPAYIYSYTTWMEGENTLLAHDGTTVYFLSATFDVIDQIQIHQTSSVETIRRLDTNLAGTKLIVQSTDAGDFILEVWDIATKSKNSRFDEPINVHYHISPDGNYLAIADRPNSTSPDVLYIYNANDGSVVDILQTDGAIGSLDWHPDGNQIVVQKSNVVQIWNVTSFPVIDTPFNISSQYTIRGRNVSYSSDGHFIAFEILTDNVTNIIEIWDTETLQYSQKIAINQGERLIYFEWTEVGIITYVQKDDEMTIQIIDPLSGNTTATMETGRYTTAEVSPDGTLALIESFDTGWQILDAGLQTILAQKGDWQEVTEYTLLNADDGTVIQTLNEGDTIDLSSIGTSNFTIQVTLVNGQTVKRVEFDLNGVKIAVDELSPYALENQALPPGSYTLTATPFAGEGSVDSIGIPLTVDFTVTE